MKWKTTLILLAVTVGVGAYISLYELKQPGQEQRRRLANQIVGLPTDAVTQLAIEMPDTHLTVVRHDDTWRLNPDGIRVNSTVVNGILGQTRSLIAERSFSSSPEQPLVLNAYGLDPAVGSLSLTTENGTTTVRFGDTTALQNNRYVQVADRPEVFVVSSQLFDLINQPAEAFHDPLLIRFSSWEAKALSARAPSAHYELAQRDGEWHLLQPIVDLADRTKVHALLSHLSRLHTQEMLERSPSAEQLSTWGLDEPVSEITLTAEAPPITIHFGHPLPSRPTASPDEGPASPGNDSAESADETFAPRLPAQRSDEPFVYAIDAADLEVLLADPQGLRSRSGFEFFTAQVSQIELTWKETTWTIERVDGTWRTPDTDAEFDQSRIATFLRQLSDLRISEFLDEVPSDLASLGLSPPAGSLTVWTAERDEPQRLLVGAAVGETSDRYARLQPRDVLVELPASVVALLETPLDQLQPEPAPSTESPSESP